MCVRVLEMEWRDGRVRNGVFVIVSCERENRTNFEKDLCFLIAMRSN